MFKQNKFTIVFPIVILTFFLVCSLAFAEGNRIGIVTGNDLNVRQSPDLSSEVLTQLSKGTKVKVISSSGDWYNISYNEVIGWVFAEYLSVRDEAIGEGTISGNGVNIRIEPDLSSDVITKLNKGEKVDVFERSGDWYKIQLPEQKYGWVFNQYIIVRDIIASRNADGEVVSVSDSEIESDSGSTLGKQIVNYSQKFLGVRYKYGSSSPSGFDCSGLTHYVFKHFNIKLERTSNNQSKHGVRVSKKNLKAGDLVFFDTNGGLNAVNHVGIYIGNGKFIHASSGRSTKKVVISDMNSGFYAGAFMTARRYIK